MKNKNILIFGFGDSGRAVFELLRKKRKKTFYIFDENEKSLEYALEHFGKLKNVYIVRTLTKRLIAFMDMLILSPGVSIYNPFVVYAKRLKKEVTGELELGFLHAKKKIIAITGTNGKTTCTRLLTDILNCAGKRAFAVGNIGYPLSRAVLEQNKVKIFVCETSSFQLETAKRFRPNIACILNITPDHINRHKTFQNYKSCKKKIFENMHRGDSLVLNCNLSKIVSSKSKKFKTFYFGEEKSNKCVYELDGRIIFKNGKKEHVICHIEDIKLIGKHNLENIMACLLISKILHVKDKYILKALRDFKLSPHRIELVYKTDTANFYDDSKATNIDSTRRAIDSFCDNTLILLGGSEKGYSFDELFKNFPKNIGEVVCFGEVGKKIFECAVTNNVKAQRFLTLREATEYACGVAKSYKNILLSPANASFDEFKSYKDRGEKFLQYIKEFYEKNKS